MMPLLLKEDKELVEEASSVVLFDLNEEDEDDEDEMFEDAVENPVGGGLIVAV